MTRTQSGFVIAGVGVGMNLLGRTGVASHATVGSAAFFALWMLASVVLCLFGIFRIIAGLFNRRKRPPPASEPPQENVWPPAPKPPSAG